MGGVRRPRPPGVPGPRVARDLDRPRRADRSPRPRGGVAALTRRAPGPSRAAIARLGRDLLAFAFPQRCPGCGAGDASPERLLCEACRGLIPPLAVALCARCLVRGREPVGCLAHPGFQVWAAWVYDERVAQLVHALKY